MEARADGGDEPSVRVAFIAGTSWCGSTILEQALGQLDGCVTLGEPFWIWDPYWPRMHCECGREYRACEFWQTALEDAYGVRRDAIRADIYARSHGLWRHSIIPTLANAKSRFHPKEALSELGAMVAPIYAAAARVSGATTVIDASKAGLWGLAISMVESVDLTVVHLVRDPMGYVASDSRSRELPYPPGAMRPGRPQFRSLITWLLLNLEADLLTRRVPGSIRVRYEDLAKNPAPVAARVARAIGLDADMSHLFTDHALTVHHAGHAIGGNPRRPRAGQTVIATSESADITTPSPRLVRHTLVPVALDRYRRYGRDRVSPS
jgi:hypothetical protein